MKHSFYPWILLPLLFATDQTALSQAGYSSFTGAAITALGAGTALQGTSSLLGNPSGLAGMNKMPVALTAESRFAGTGISRVGLAGAIPVGRGIFGSVWLRTGFSTYSEHKMGVFYVRSLSKTVAASLQLNYFLQNGEGQPSWSTMSTEIGGQAKLSTTLVAGVHVFHPAGLLLPEKSGLESRIRVGFRYAPMEGVFLTADLDKPAWRTWTVRTGIGYSPQPNCQIYLGVAPSLGIFSFGVSLNKKNGFHISAAAATHQNLGTTSGVTIGYQ